MGLQDEGGGPMIIWPEVVKWLDVILVTDAVAEPVFTCTRLVLQLSPNQGNKEVEATGFSSSFIVVSALFFTAPTVVTIISAGLSEHPEE